MFEGQPLPLSAIEVLATPLFLAMIGLVATALLRLRFQREWTLTVWTAYQIKRVWQRLADESARTGGTITSHALGLICWALLGSFWEFQTLSEPSPHWGWTGAGWGILLGCCTLLTRHIGGWIGAWVTLEEEAVQRGFEVDRHMRNWLLWLLIAWLVWEAGQNIGFNEREVIWSHLLWVWFFWLALKWIRQIQSIAQKRLHFSWGIAYICTLEIGPSYLLYCELG